MSEEASTNAPPPELMAKLAKLAKLQQEFTGGFVIFLPPQSEKSKWVGVFRYNPKMLTIIEALYNNITGGRMMGGSQN